MPSRARRALRLQLPPLIAGFVVLALIVGTRTLLVESQLDDNEAVRQAFELERHVAATMSLLQDAESGQRGFVLTREEPYLEPYTGFTRNAVVHNGVLDHGVDFIAKPFTVDQQAAKLLEVLDA